MCKFIRKKNINNTNFAKKINKVCYNNVGCDIFEKKEKKNQME